MYPCVLHLQVIPTCSIECFASVLMGLLSHVLLIQRGISTFVYLTTRVLACTLNKLCCKALKKYLAMFEEWPAI